MIADNTMEVATGNNSLDQSDPAYTDDFNALFESLYRNTDYTCFNDCELCLDSGSCGAWETSESSRLTFTKGNITWEDIISLDYSAGTPHYSRDTFKCVTYTQNFGREVML